jgi:hypothetical protein
MNYYLMKLAAILLIFLLMFVANIVVSMLESRKARKAEKTGGTDVICCA